jgi:hypothetical protein
MRCVVEGCPNEEQPSCPFAGMCSDHAATLFRVADTAASLRANLSAGSCTYRGFDLVQEPNGDFWLLDKRKVKTARFRAVGAAFRYIDTNIALLEALDEDNQPFQYCHYYVERRYDAYASGSWYVSALQLHCSTKEIAKKAIDQARGRGAL